MFCSKCGNKLPEDSKFCNKCGANLSMDSSSAYTESESQVQADTQMNVPNKTNNSKKIGIVAAAVLVPIIAVVAFFALRPWKEDSPIFVDTSTAPSYLTQAEAPVTYTPTTSELEMEVALLLYIERVNKTVADEHWFDDSGTMALVYIDNDDIPELIVDWGSHAGGSQIFTVSNGELVYIHTGLGLSYKERQNRFIHGGGRMGYYHDTIFSIQHGEFVRLHRGDWDELKEQVSWDGENITWQEYEKRLNAAFDRSRATSVWEQLVSAEEMTLKLNTRLITSNSNASVYIEEIGQSTNEPWVEVDALSDISISIPATWSYSTVFDGKFTSLTVSGSGSDGIPVTLVVEDSMLLGNNMFPCTPGFDGTSTQIVFNDLRHGYMIEVPFVNEITWLREDLEHYVSFNHGGNRSIFTNNEELILGIVRTLTSAVPTTYQEQENPPQTDTLETQQPTQPQGITSDLDARLIGTWTLKEIESIWGHEESEFAQSTELFGDGTGFEICVGGNTHWFEWTIESEFIPSWNVYLDFFVIDSGGWVSYFIQ